MIIRLCIALTVAHAARIQRVSFDNLRDFEAEMIHRGNGPNDTATLSDPSTIALQMEALNAENTQFASPTYDPSSKEHVEMPKAATTPAITDKYQGWRKAEELQEAIAAAIKAIINEAKAVATAEHDNEFHLGYYRAVKSGKACVAAVEVASESIEKAEQLAQATPGPVVLKKLLEFPELGQGATLDQLLDQTESRIDRYVEQVGILGARYDGDPGTGEYVQQMLDLRDEVRDMREVGFDAEIMIKISLWLFRKTLELLEFDYHTAHKGANLPRVLQEKSPPDMSSKMKSEASLFAFLKHMSELEKHPELTWKKPVRAEKPKARRA